MIKARPTTLKEANAFVGAVHRHHGQVVGHRFSFGAEIDDHRRSTTTDRSAFLGRIRPESAASSFRPYASAFRRLNRKSRADSASGNISKSWKVLIVLLLICELRLKFLDSRSVHALALTGASEADRHTFVMNFVHPHMVRVCDAGV